MSATLPAVVEPPTEGPILVIAAHPDDMEAWCAGTVTGAIDQGMETHLVLATSGDKGSPDPYTDPRELAERREEEARAAAEILGFRDVSFLGHPDGELENTVELRRQIAEAIRRVQPFALFTFDPEHPLPPYTSHRDHRTIGRATLDCAYPLARDPLVFPEQIKAGLQPHKVKQAWLFASAIADRYVDISTTFDRKVEARIAHSSQTADPAAVPDNWRRRAASHGEPVGLELAERFTVVDIR